MKLTATFQNGFCYFNGFDPVINKKAGINYCRCKCIASIFSCIGITCPIRYEKNGELKICYVYRWSLYNWVENFDDYFGQVDFPDREGENNLSQQELDIKLICEKVLQDINWRGSNRKINPGKPISYSELIEKAGKEFAEYENKKEIMESIINISLGNSYPENVHRGIPPYFHNMEDGYFEFKHSLGSKKDKMIMRVRQTAMNFLESLPGVETTEYMGPSLQ